MHIFKLNKIYLHSRHYFTSSNCIFMQLQGIVFIQLQGNDILDNCQGNTDSFKEHIFIHKKYNHSRQLYSDTKLYSFSRNLISSFKEISPRSMKKYSFREIISIQGNMFTQGTYIRSTSRPYVHPRKLYLLNIVAFAE